MERTINKLGMALIGGFIIADILTNGTVAVNLSKILSDTLLGFARLASGQRG